MLKVLTILLRRLSQERRSWVEATSHHPTHSSLLRHIINTLLILLGAPCWRATQEASLFIFSSHNCSRNHFFIMVPSPYVNDSSSNKSRLRKTVLYLLTGILLPFASLAYHGPLCGPHKGSLNGKHSCQRDLGLNGVFLLF